MAQSLIILGTGSNTLDIMDIVDAVNQKDPVWELLGCLDDAQPVGIQSDGTEVLARVRDAGRYPGCLFVNAIGSDRSYRKRPDIVAQTQLPPNRFAVLIHPQATVSRRATLGPGSCVNAGAVIACGSAIGSHVWVEAGCVVGANAVVGDHAMIASGVILGPSVRVGSAVYVGCGACVRRRVSIGERSLVGVGGVVINDVLPGTSVVGNPARVLVRMPRQQGRSLGDISSSHTGMPAAKPAHPEPIDPTSQSSDA